MKTTVLIIEYLFGGVLVLLALMLLVASLFPPLMGALGSFLRHCEFPDSIRSILAIIFAAVVYGVGLISEYVGGEIFEWWLKRIKRARLAKYLRKNYANLGKSTILAEYAAVPLEQISVTEEAIELIGAMRFHVMMESPELYQEIESQINRFRLVRVLFLVEVIVVLAMTIQMLRVPSPILVCLLVLVLVLAVANVSAVKRRFERYCRAVERSYKVLVLDR
jgi:hypothetical protein